MMNILIICSKFWFPIFALLLVTAVGIVDVQHQIHAKRAKSIRKM